ncbi:hypothetical protein ES319_D06G158100v1 [Gossypium barbadense]|uniref:O-methyltransferase domain-containing protein n=1 Tax=Gossypium barbadense TaxID=3634 RepID=A0A5J5R5T5_GOSBA|nr:hypothetical protein ES319_D06G158100v1 [Gossypium barbadense]
MDQEANESFRAQARLYKHIFNYVSSMSLKCAVQLGIPDAIHNHGKPITLSELVSAPGIVPTKASFTYRLMRVLVHAGFFATTKVNKGEEKEAYVLTPFSKILVKEKINCLSPFVKSPFETANGKPFWDYMDHDPVFKALFHDAMRSDSQMMNLVVKDCEQVFEGVNSLVDVGGGTGTIARVISEAYPQLKCTVFDLPHVVANLPTTGNLNFVGGDLFQHIPSTDAILMKLLLVTTIFSHSSFNLWLQKLALPWFGFVFTNLFNMAILFTMLAYSIPSEPAFVFWMTWPLAMSAGLVTASCSIRLRPVFPGIFAFISIDARGFSGSGLKCTFLVIFSPTSSSLFLSIEVILHLILHAFDDEKCIKILKKCREAIPTQGEKGKMIIIDIVINVEKDEHELTEAKLFFDMLMTGEVSGRERTEQD